MSFLTLSAETPTQKFERAVSEKYGNPTNGYYTFLLLNKVPMDTRMVKSLKGLPILFKVKPDIYKEHEFKRYKLALTDTISKYLIELRKGYPRTQRLIWDTEYIYHKITTSDSPLQQFFDSYQELYWINEWYKNEKPEMEYVYEDSLYYNFFCADHNSYRIKK